MTIYRTLLAWLAAMSADPHDIDRAKAKSFASVSAAYATFAPLDPAPAPPAPVDECGCGGTCKNGEWKPDLKIPQKCKPGCKSCPKSAGVKAGGN